MAKAGGIIGKVFERLGPQVRQGVSTQYLDELAASHIRLLGGKPAFLNYNGFPGNTCTSLNCEVVHGIPRKDCILKEGDILGWDIGVEFEGYFADAAATFAVGEISAEARRLMDVTKRALYLGIKQAKPGNRVSDISSAIQRHAEENGFNVVRDLVGHGIGSKLHEQPEVPNFCVSAKPSPRLEAGMALAIEPMINQGAYEVEMKKDGTFVTKDASLSAHFEHTVVIKENGPMILTEWQKKNR